MRRKRIVAIVSIFLLLTLSVWLVFTYIVLPASVVELQVWTADEIGTVHQLVGANSYGPDITGLYQDQVAYDLFQNLGLQRLRVWCRFGWQLAASSGWGTHHTIFNGTSFADAQNPNYYNWTYLDLLVDVVNNTGAKPILTFTGCPRSLHPNWAPNKGPVNLTIYAEVVAHVVMHYEQGWPGTGQIFDFDYIEIGNEPNLPAFWDGTQQDFFDLYNIVSRRLALISSAFKIGGPGLADIELNNWTTNFLTTVNGLGLPLDFFSWHAYWNDPAHVVETIHTGTTLLRDQGFGHLEQVFDEYGLDLLSDTNWGTMTAAVHTTEVLMGAAKNGVDIACFAFAKDVPIHPNITTVFGDEANFGLLTRNPTTPKPTYHALKPFAAIANQTVLNATLVQPPMLLSIPAPLSSLVTRGPGPHNYTVLLSNHGIRSITVQISFQGGPTGPFQIARRELSAATIQQHNDWTPPSQSTNPSITVTCSPQSIQWLSICQISSNASPLYRIVNPVSSDPTGTVQFSRQNARPLQVQLIRIIGYAIGNDIQGHFQLNVAGPPNLTHTTIYFNQTLVYNTTEHQFIWSFYTDNYPLGWTTIRVQGYDTDDTIYEWTLSRQFVSSDVNTPYWIAALLFIVIFTVSIIAAKLHQLYGKSTS